MRKATFLLLLLLVPIVSRAEVIVEVGTKLYPGSAVQNTTDVPSGYYLIKSKSSTYSETPYLVVNGDALNLAASPDLGGTNVGLWKIAYKQSASAEDTKGSEYYILNVSNSKYFTQGPSVPVGTTKYAYWLNKTAEDTYQIGLSSSSGLNTNAIGATSATSFARGSGEQDFELVPVTFFETPASVGEATKWYRIQGKKSGYVNYNATANISLSSTVSDNDLWCFVPQSDGTYKIYSRADQTKVWGAFGVTTANTSGSIKLTTADDATASATTFQILPTYADYPYMGFRINTSVSSTAYINQTSGTTLGCWNNAQAIYGWGSNVGTNITGNGDNGSGFKFVEVAIADVVTYNVSVTGAATGGIVYNETRHDGGSSFTAGALLTASDLQAQSVEGYHNGYITISQVSTFEFNVNVAYAPQNPIVPTTITEGAFAENTQWYRLIINRSPKKYSRFDKVNNVTVNSTEKTTDRNSFFCFVADDAVENGYKIYNMAAGTRKAFTSTGTNNEICTYSEAGTTFVLTHNTNGADGYQFRVNGMNYAYFNDVNGKIGVWNSGNNLSSTDAGGTFLLVEGKVTAEELASLTADFADLNTIIAKAEQYTIGSGVGQYTDASDGTFTSALAAAKAIDQNRTDIAYQSTIDEAMENLKAALTGLTINIPPTGKYYRLRVTSQSEAGDNYLSAYGNGTNLNTKVVESEAPTVFYLTADNKLQAVYNDAYISNAATSNFAALQTTANVDDAMVWTLAGSTTVPGTYTLKAGENALYLYDWTTYSRGNTLVCSDIATARCQWTIEEVSLDEAMVKEFDLSLIAPCQALATIPLVEGAELTYPSEYTYTPAELNAALVAVKAVSASNTLTEVKSVLLSSDFATAQHYKGLCDSYGAALSVTCTLKGKYATLILPINFTFPANWSLYSCSSVNGNVLELTPFINGVDKNIPLIVEYTDDASMPTSEAPKSYQFIGYSNGAGTENVTAGCLTGVLSSEATPVPADSYVLAYQKSTGKQGFFKTDGTVVCPQFKCYLTVPASSTEAASALYFDEEGMATGIEGIFAGNGEEVIIYNVAGQRISKLQKGVNIVNGHKVLVK